MAYIDDYVHKQYTGFEPEFSDGFVTTLGLSVANGIERAVNMTALYADEIGRFTKENQAKFFRETYTDSDLADYTATLFEEEATNYKNVIEKRKDNQRRLEEIINEAADIHNLGTPARIANNFVAGFVEGLNPVEMAVDSISGGIAGKVVGWASRSRKIGKYMNASRKALAESFLAGVAGGSYNAFQMNYIYDDVTAEQMLSAVGNGALFSVALNRVGRYLGNRKKIRTPKELNEFRKAVRGDTITNPKVKQKAAQFMASIQDMKLKTDLSNQDLVMDTMDKIIDTHFLIGKKISKEEVLDMLKVPKHSEVYELGSEILSFRPNRENLASYETNRQLKTEVAQEYMELLQTPEVTKALSELGEKRLRLNEITSKKGRLKKSEKAEIETLRAEIVELEKSVDLKKFSELEAQMKKLDVEGKELKTKLTDELQGYDIDSFLAEKYKYQEEFLSPDVDKIAHSLGEDVKSESVKENEYVGTDPKKRAEVLEEDIKAGKININDEELKTKATEFNDIEKDWTNNISEKTELVKEWITKGCEL